jgi:anti-sigma regulatory factor (Ser/Thr protein kinase)
MTAPTVAFSVLPDVADISARVQEVQAFLRSHRVDDLTTDNVAVVIEELMTNTATHGGSQRPIALTLTVAPGLVEGRIVDHGIAYDPRKGPSVDIGQPLKDRHAGGLGLFFVRQFCSSLSYASADGQNVLDFTIDRPSVAAD